MDLQKIKQLRKIVASNPDREFYTDECSIYKIDQNINRGLQEAKMMYLVKNLNAVARIVSSGVVEELHVIESEYFSGFTLEQKQKYNNKEILDISDMIISACSNLSSINIIHGDINESNIIYNPSLKSICIIDFEFSHHASESDKKIFINNKYICEKDFYSSAKYPWGVKHVINYMEKKKCD